MCPSMYHEWRKTVPCGSGGPDDGDGGVDDIASLVAFVASPEAAYITGASLTVDGGTNA